MQDPLKQGLKRIFLYWMGVSWVIRMQDPLKQGLKPSVLLMGVFCRVHSNARSIKTRIETDLHSSVLWETTKIRMQDPLKQGLKPFMVLSSFSFRAIRMQDPLKQGLKPQVIGIHDSICTRFECKIH